MSLFPDHLEKVSLRVTTGNPLAEIFLIDHAFALVDRAVSEFRRDVTPGIYKVKVRLGDVTAEQLVLLHDDRHVDMSSELALTSPAPLAGTSRTREPYAEAAHRAGQQVKLTIGHGAQILLMARSWATRGSTDATHPESTLSELPSAAPPGRPSLHHPDGTLLAELGDLSSPIRSFQGSAYAATIAVDPGPYLLRWYDEAATGEVEQAVYAVADWQTQVFLLREADDSLGLHYSVTMLISQHGYEPDNAMAHTVEVARSALAKERKVTSETNDLLFANSSDPMLALFGAHLMLIAAEAHPSVGLRQDVFDDAVANATRLLGVGHPDVVALSTKTSRGDLDALPPVTTPPLLWRSWVLLLEASHDRPALVPAHIWRRASRPLPSRPFLTWSVHDDEDYVEEEIAAEVRRRIHAVARESVGITASQRAELPILIQMVLRWEREEVSRQFRIPSSAIDELISNPTNRPVPRGNVTSVATQAEQRSESRMSHPRPPTEEFRIQEELARQRIQGREAARRDTLTNLEHSDGLVRANDPMRMAKRLDRVTRYLAGEDPMESPAETPASTLVRSSIERMSDVLDAVPVEVTARAEEGLPSTSTGGVPDRGRVPAPMAEMLLERLINAPDFVSVRFLDAGAIAHHTVGRITIRDAHGSVRGYGTGFLVSPSLLLTNHHLLPDARTANSSFIEFDYQDGIDGQPLTPTRLTFAPDRFFIANRELDFALVAVDAGPQVLAGYGFCRLSAAQGTVLIGEAVTIVQHPRGERKQIVVRENRVIDIPETVVHYVADTEPASSGSPVFNDQWEVVALHHATVFMPQNSPEYRFLNEGIRISRILDFLSAAPLTPDQRKLVEELSTATPAATARAGVAASPAGAPAAEAVALDPDYAARSGYNADFLGVRLPLPDVGALADVASAELKYHHFSVVMHRRRRLALFTAVNIDGRQSTRPRRDSDRWIIDPRLPREEQTGEDVYRDNPLDRGHLVRRLDPAWGPTALAANDDTFHFTNATPQHHDFNAGRTLWLGLEDYILNNTDNRDLAVSVITGPVLDPDDPLYRGVALPRQFFKVVAMVTTGGVLSATAYLLSQEALLDEFATGLEEFSFGAYRTFQVAVRRVAEMTGLGLAPYVAGDPLELLESRSLPREILRPADLLLIPSSTPTTETTRSESAVALPTT